MLSPLGALGRPRLHLRVTDSTNERARALAARGAPHGTLVTAGAQTAGRGRHGRAWVAPAGSSLLASLVVRTDADRAPLLPLATAVAVCEGCEAVAPVRASIKWPNDVWIDGRKLAGILLEGRAQEGWAVLGFGVNVALRAGDLPEELRTSATSLAEAAPGASPPGVEAVLHAILAALEARLAQTPSETIAAWSERDALRGREVRWSTGEGTARGIDADGSLMVETGDGPIELHSGEVSLLRPLG